MSEITHTNTGNKGSNVRLIVGLVVTLALLGGVAYGFATGVFKTDSSYEMTDGD